MNQLYGKFGELLKLERQRKGIKLEELSEQLKISETNLEHIEKGEVKSLPSLIYYNLFAKSFAEALGVDFERTIDAIREDLGESIVEEEPAPRGAPAAKKPKKRPEKPKKAETETEETSTPIKKLIYLFIAIVAIFVIFLAAYMIFFQSEAPATGEGHVPSEATETTRTSVEETHPEAQSSGFDWDVPDYREPQLMKLRLVSRNESWSTVIADGDTAIFRNLIPGRPYEAAAMYRLVVSIGIPSQVDAELNGRPVDLRDAETGRISRVEINQLNLEEIIEGRRDRQADDLDQTDQQLSTGGNPQSDSNTAGPVDTTGVTAPDENDDGED